MMPSIRLHFHTALRREELRSACIFMNGCICVTPEPEGHMSVRRRYEPRREGRCRFSFEKEGKSKGPLLIIRSGNKGKKRGNKKSV